MLSTYTNSCALVNCKYRVLPKCPVRYHGMAPTVTLKPGSGVSQGHWFWYQWKACIRIPISDN